MVRGQRSLIQRFFLTIVSLLACVAVLRGAEDEPPLDSAFPLAGSSLAPERPLRADYPPEVEAVLARMEDAAPPEGAFSVSVAWEAPVVSPLDRDRDGVGLDSFKTGLNWSDPPESAPAWQCGSLLVAGAGDQLRMTRLAEDGTAAEWWHIERGNLCASRMLEVLPFVTRYRAAEALESGMLAYGEGLGLLLWALEPQPYLRRAPHLVLGEPAIVNGRSLQRLVAVPEWIESPPTLPNREYYPYNESTLRSWAELSPVVTYYMDPATGAIEGATFDYHQVTRSNRGRWTAGATPAGRRLEAWVLEWGMSSAGHRFPVRIEGKYLRDARVARSTILTVAEAPVTAVPALELARGRRIYSPWPPYESSVYASRLTSAEDDYANRVGLVHALAFEGDLAGALAGLKDLLERFRVDRELVPESMGGIDWHLGYAVYEILGHPESAEYQALWNDFPPTEPFVGILARAVDFFARWRRAADAELADRHFAMFEARFGMKARLLYVGARALAPRVETEAVRGLEFQQILDRATSDEIRLGAIEGAIESFLRAGDYARAVALLERARALLADPDNVERFDELSEGWSERIDRDLAERYEVLEEAALRSKRDLLRELTARQARARAFRNPEEVRLLERLIEDARRALAALER